MAGVGLGLAAMGLGLMLVFKIAPQIKDMGGEGQDAAIRTAGLIVSAAGAGVAAGSWVAGPLAGWAGILIACAGVASVGAWKRLG